MCIPFAAVAAAATVLGTAVTAYGQIRQGQAAGAASEYNAKVSRIMATDALQRGDVAEETSRRQQGQLAGQQNAVLAARGLDLNRGSALGIRQDTAQLGAFDASTIRADARREATSYLNQATLQDFEGRNAKTGGLLSAFGTVLGGIGQVAKGWYQRGATPGGPGGGGGGYLGYGQGY